jgi:hypothetical protein
MTRDDLKRAVLKGINHHGGKAKLIDIAKYIWEHYEPDLRASGDRFFRWQYEMRWAANELRKDGSVQPADLSPKGVWEAK